jgi:hypothetical protein
MRIKQMRIQLSKLVLTAIFGFAMAFTFGCSDDKGKVPDTIPDTGSGGGLTITDIPSEYNGKYAFFLGVDVAGTDGKSTLKGCQQSSQKPAEIKFSPISNGRVSIPVWIHTTINIDADAGTTDTDIRRYSGSDTYTDITVLFADVEYNKDFLQEKAKIVFQSVTFQNGNDTKSWSDGISE